MTIAIAPSSLSPDLLARRLRELAGEERDVQVDFLLHLDEFDRRRAFLEAGYGSLWEYCLRALHLREGPAGRRIAAMRVMRRVPSLEPALRDGRLCLSTVTLIAPLLTEENLDEVVARAAFKTKAEVEHLVASLQPRAAPKDGVRKLAQRAAAGEADANNLGFATAAGLPLDRSHALDVPATTAPAAPADPSGTASTATTRRPTLAADVSFSPTPTAPMVATPEAVLVPAPASMPAIALTPRPPASTLPLTPAARPRAELRPVSGEEWSLRVTMDASMKADLDTLKALLGHTAGSDLSAVVCEALRCAVEKHGRRRGAVRPARTRSEVPVGASRTPAATHEARLREGEREAARDARPAVMRGSAAAAEPAADSASAVDAGAAAIAGSEAEAARANRGDGARARSPAPTRHVPAAVRRAVWERDGGRCAWTSSDGRRCAAPGSSSSTTSYRSREVGPRRSRTFAWPAARTTCSTRSSSSGASTWRGSSGGEWRPPLRLHSSQDE